MLWRLFKHILSYESVVIILFITAYIICRAFNITCIIYAITGIRCPACYMGRALISFAKGDFGLYAEYNIMAIPVAVVFLYELFCKRLGISKRILHICSAFVLVINLIYYLFRLLFVF